MINGKEETLSNKDGRVMGNIYKRLAVVLASLAAVACGQSGTTYSMMTQANSFKQANVTNSQIDMLWVVDNSGSMDPLQQNMTTNFNSFMDQFVSKGYDFHLAVTSTDTYLALSQFNNTPSYARFSDGVTTHTGVFDILPTTPNVVNTFVTNATLGSNGSGDERAFSSFKAALNSNLNTGFLRPSSFFAVVILSDEDDFSDPSRPEYSWTYRGGIPDHDYNNPGLETVASYESYLDTLTGTTGASRRYTVNAITVLDSTCQQQHVSESPSTIIGQRYIQMANDTNGVLGSVCDASYATSLEAIQTRILELGTQFYLNNQPVVSSITVDVNGVQVPNDPNDGWTYNSAANSIMFHGAAVPPAGSTISVNFDPQKLTF